MSIVPSFPNVNLSSDKNVDRFSIVDRFLKEFIRERHAAASAAGDTAARMRSLKAGNYWRAVKLELGMP